MNIQYAESADFNAWIALAKEVEHLFGPMAQTDVISDCLEASHIK